MVNNQNSSSSAAFKMRNHQQESSSSSSTVSAAQQQTSYMGGVGVGIGGGGGGSSSTVTEAGSGVQFNGQSQVFETSSSGFQSYLHGVSRDWTPEEQSILEEGLIKYASESNLMRYAKIAVLLSNKTVRDVALRCKWIAKRDIGKRRKSDLSLVGKSRLKEKFSEPSVVSSHAATQTQQAFDAGFSYTADSGHTGELLDQNAQAFQCIAANFSIHQLHENIGLLCLARDNLSKILNSLSNPPNLMKKLPPLPVKIDEELANSILPPPPPTSDTKMRSVLGK